jgi:hypothetical protein
MYPIGERRQEALTGRASGEDLGAFAAQSWRSRFLDLRGLEADTLVLLPRRPPRGPFG